MFSLNAGGARLSSTGSSGRIAIQRTSPEHGRLTHALLLSLLIHTLLLSLTFGGQGLWLPGFGFAWRGGRIEAPAKLDELWQSLIRAGQTF